MKLLSKVFTSLCCLGLLIVTSCGSTDTEIINLRVGYAEEPLAIEDKNPLFGWQMKSEKTGQEQTAYQIKVAKEDGTAVWDSGKVASGLSNNIGYQGDDLEAETAYEWQLTVWDVDGKSYTKSSSFETGLMNPDLAAWDGAQFIGTNALTLDAASAILFDLETDIQIVEGNTASLIIGANDFRFNDKFQNINNAEGENYLRIQIDVSGVGTAKGAAIHLYRVGFSKEDSADTPYMTISKVNYPGSNINQLLASANRSSANNFKINVSASNILIKINGETLLLEPEDPNNPIPPQFRNYGFNVTGTDGGGNYLTYPHINSIGFASEPGSKAIFKEYKISNAGKSNPENNLVFGKETGATYALFESFEGVTVQPDGSIEVSNTSDETMIDYADPSFGSATMLRSNFTTEDKNIAKAKLYVTSMGSNEVYINGERIGEDWFAPGATQFRETLGYFAYDVTENITTGENTIGSLIFPGWYTGYMTYTPNNFNFFGDTEGLLTKLVITFDDGSEQTVVSNPESWKIFTEGPVEYGSFFQGERYNALKEENIAVEGNVLGWSTTAYDDSKWTEAEVVKPREWIDFDIVSRYDRPVRVVEQLKAKEVMEIHSEDETTYTYNMGVNMVGVPSITVPEGWLKKGDTVVLRYGEQLYPGLDGDEQQYIDMYGYDTGKGVAGRILTENYRAAMATDFYIAKGEGQATIQPRTTFRGYQYVQVTLPSHVGALPLENVVGLSLSSDKLPSGTYVASTTDETTGELANQLFKNIQRSQLGNFFTLPTDCPQRNERMGWTGDAQAYTRTGTYNSDTYNFFRQWMVALRDDQGVGSDTEAAGGIGSTVPTYNMSDDTTFADGTTWAAAVCMVPWQLYVQYGDTKVIEENMETMRQWLEGMDYYDFSEEFPHLSSKTTGLADWLAMDNNTPPELVNNAIYIYMMEVTAIMADAIGEAEYANTLKDRHQLAKEEWNQLFVDPDSGRTKNLQGFIVHSQSSYATPLNFNVFSDENKPKAEALLAGLVAQPSTSNTTADGTRVVYPGRQGPLGGFGMNSEQVTEDFLPYTITTGFSGTPNILPSLSRGGKVDEAYKLFSSTDYTSWLYPVTKGATSIWERWNGFKAAFKENNENRMNSFNHFALGAVGQWMYEFQLGITTDHINGQAGYKDFVLQPQVAGSFEALTGSYDSNYGKIYSSWTSDGSGNMTSYNATVPANTKATLYLPMDVDGKSISMEGVSYKGTEERNGIEVEVFELSSGTYEFTK
ncbi:family 78 glycoside hydrolase catalytic domain [Flagellimonas zhangzhouensis]|uniref:alpha-L-rhamnosidase n=1 Tax=Flagellimonas zhangzhouensis TaxID=1073328 RepID=A0A1H2T010_9FLAO|nr:family 78 glycoside hydrolase catalytic domain [Allomuricauda zhangzhouensis]SDQ81848.1 alpha-L-rhamnosidase [Allomuricauda zhangzhouensis]SDW37140.1 alpha-L-rhamnosidase [Allomuricauda zhangzhouensis]